MSDLRLKAKSSITFVLADKTDLDKLLKIIDFEK
jgi:hypothetical protein